MSGKETRKEKILRAARKVFAAHSVSEVGLVEIARQAKLSRPLVTYYYQDVDSVFYDVVLQLLQELKADTVRAVHAPSKDILETLRQYVNANFDWVEKQPDSARLWMYFYYLSNFSPRFRELNDEIRQTGRDRIQQILYKGIATRVLSDELLPEVEDLALQIQGIIHGNNLLSFTESRLPAKRMKDLAYRKILRLLRVD